MNRALSQRKQRQRRNAHHVRRSVATARRDIQWALMRDFDEGPDTEMRELIGRIARGEMIRGHTL